MLIVIFGLLAFSGQSTAQTTCHVPGECQDGVYLLSAYANTYEECLVECKLSSYCNYFTHKDEFDQNDCLLFSTCPSLNETSCSVNCYSGEKACGGTVLITPTTRMSFNKTSTAFSGKTIK